MTGPSVGDPATMKSRLLSRQCSTCILRAGDPMALGSARLRDFIRSARDAGSYVICHSTLPGVAPPGVKPAICRGFYDAYPTRALRMIAALFGFTEVDPPDPEGDMNA